MLLASAVCTSQAWKAGKFANGCWHCTRKRHLTFDASLHKLSNTSLVHSITRQKADKLHQPHNANFRGWAAGAVPWKFLLGAVFILFWKFSQPWRDFIFYNLVKLYHIIFFKIPSIDLMNIKFFE